PPAGVQAGSRDLSIGHDKAGMCRLKTAILAPPGPAFANEGTEPALAATRPVVALADGTGIPAEPVGHSLLPQLTAAPFPPTRLPFVDSVERAHEVAEKIRAAGEEHGVRPIVVNSSVNPEIAAVIARSGALVLDVFEPFLAPLEAELGEK